jgi:hypothetical protein
VAEAKLASNDTELSEAHEEVSRLQHEQQLLRQEVADLNARAEQIKAAHIEALKEADAKAEINRLGRQLAIRELLPGAGPTNDDSSDRLESSHTTPVRGRSDQCTTSGSSDTPRDRPSTLVHSIAHEAKYLKGASITRDDVSKFVAFLESYDANGEYVQGGVTKFIDIAATKTITMKLRKTQVGQELLWMSNWIPHDAWRDMWTIQDIIAGLKEAYVRPSAQLFTEIDDIWEKRIDDFEKSATVDPLRLTESIEVNLIHQMLEFTTNQAPPSKEMERQCLERFETILTGKRNPKRFNDTHKKFQLALNVYLGTCCSTITMMCCMIGNVSYSHPPTTSLRVTIVPPMTSRIGQGSPGSLMGTLSTTIHALTVGRIIVPVCAS